MFPMLNSIKKLASLERIMASPRAMELLQNPRVQKLVGRALSLPGLVREAVTARAHRFAAYTDLLTRDDLQGIRRQMRELDRQVRQLERKLAEERAKLEKAQAALQRSGGGNGHGEATAPPAPTDGIVVGKKKKIVIGKKKKPAGDA